MASLAVVIIILGCGVYQYFNVPQTVYAAFMRASSKGGYLNDHIKDRYRFRKLC